MSHGIKCGVSGLFMLEAVNKDTGERRTLAPWFPNLITDAGLDRMGIGGVLENCSVGSGSNPPVVTDTALQSLVATTTSLQLNDFKSARSTPPYYGSVTHVYRFGIGVAAGNLSEVAIGWSGGIFSRSLIKDGLGNPTTVTVLANEYLDVTYQVRLYPPTEDTTFQVVSAQGVTHNCVARASRVTNSLYWPGGDPGLLGGIAFEQAVRTYNASATISNGTIGPITSGVANITNSASSTASGPIFPMSHAAYVPFSQERVATLFVPPEVGNFAAGISALRVLWSLGEFQYSFDPPIQKLSTQTLTIGLRISWARRAL
jgi:hypothetical protein